MLSGSIATVEEERVLRLTDDEEAGAFPFPFTDNRSVGVGGGLLAGVPTRCGPGVDSRRGGAEAARRRARQSREDQRAGEGRAVGRPT